MGSLRIDQSHPLLPAVERGRAITVLVDGQAVTAYQGETVATVLLASGRRNYHYSTRLTSEPWPGFFCGIGVCYGCTVWVDGYLQRACLTPVAENMQILTRPEVTP